MGIGNFFNGLFQGEILRKAPDMPGTNEIGIRHIDFHDNIMDVDGKELRFPASEDELRQFPNLKKATIMSSQYDSMAKIFTNVGIEVESL